jgi:inosine-uridine nucleoside N-ribohydrolase
VYGVAVCCFDGKQESYALSSRTALLEYELQSAAVATSKIEQIIWMGGAIKVAGNLDLTTVPTPPWNNCAEWNAFWDAPSVDWVFKNTTCPIIQFPIDMTNRAAITTSFMETLAVQARSGSRYSELAFESYMLVSYETFYDMWDSA